MQNFFSYRLQVDRLPQQEQHYRLRADKEDCAKIREILKVPAVKSFSSDINLKFNQKEHRIRLWGRVEAELELESVISLELFDKKYETDFELEYDTEATLKSQRQEEEELSIEDNIPVSSPGCIVLLKTESWSKCGCGGSVSVVSFFRTAIPLVPPIYK